MTDTITLPRSVIEQAIESMQGYARETGDTQPCDAEKALRAALAQQAEQGWQPIETAPKNKAVDLWCKSTSNPVYGRRVTSVCLVGDDWYGANLPSPSFGEYASHWMPLPAAPKGGA